MHVPVLLKEVIHYLNPQANKNFIDATAGEGGHGLAILRKNGPNGKLLNIEVNSGIYKILQEKMSEMSKRVILVNDSYINLEKIVEKNDFKPVHGILFDLGICSWHLETSGKGFSYLKDEPLDMRFDSENDLTAAEIVNTWEIEKIEEILKEFGEEKYAHRISLAIKEARKKKRIIGTQQLVDILKRTLPKNYDNRKIHFARRTFQGLRIAVNDELQTIEKGIEQAIKILEPDGRIVVISFHSLEDRIVKNIFREKAKIGKLNILTKKPITPNLEEIKNNSRSRSAKLRAAQKI
ncbi:16S rRNA (cytosine(1402)-N(4))-methyltransferase [Candidatus Pacearchaeota archaeon]|nr:MAG: 16S rRNA (cytosine(1402)-N(4))-methyltransferase [Candidatus Pacearchaeota archaeon]